MKRNNKLLVIGLVVVFVAVFSVSTASAGWMSNATINSVQVSSSGDHVIKATSGSLVKYLSISSSDVNKKEMLAAALTAYSNQNIVTFMYTGSYIDRIYIK